MPWEVATITVACSGCHAGTLIRAGRGVVRLTCHHCKSEWEVDTDDLGQGQSGGLRSKKAARGVHEQGESGCAKPHAQESQVLNMAFAALWLFFIVTGLLGMFYTSGGRLSLLLILMAVIGHFSSRSYPKP